MKWEEAITRGLAQLAIGCYLLRVAIDVWASPDSRLARVNRYLWTWGCAALWLHIVAAFHFIHDWHHAEAVRQTAEQTRELLGIPFGGGVYINYAFALLWLFDTVQLWRTSLNSDAKMPAWFWTVHAIFAFMVFNATVIFGPVYWRSIGLAFVALMMALWLVRRFVLDR